jgi:peptide/nickel transport system substrate-binding protein
VKLRLANPLAGRAKILPTMLRRIAAVLGVLVLAGIAVFFYTRTALSPGLPAEAPTRAKAGGTLTATVRATPTTFNRFATQSFPTHLVSLLTDGRLARVNPQTDQPEPWLAERITATGTTLEITLREGLRFSDGTPATADDVVWSLKAAYATPQGGIGDALRINRAEIQARAESATRVVLTLPRPWAPAQRLLEALPIYPRAVIEPALAAGTFADACATSAPCPGLGPFMVTRYDAGERIVLARNPHYWRKTSAGTPLPYLDGLTLEIVPSQDAELVRLASGQADLTQSELRAEDIRTLRADADGGRVVITDVGRGLDRHVLWFNLGPAPIEPEKAFLREDAFRQAVSLAVDRTGFANTVFLGAAEPSSEPVAAANTAWTAVDLPRPAYNPAQAATLLDGLELRDRDNDGLREDAAGRPVRFAVLVQSGITAAQTAMSFVRDALANVGVGLDIVALDLGTVMTNFQTGKYDAVFHYVQVSDTDPAGNLDFWLSRGPGHLWHPGQETPATPWEAEIDRRMLLMASTFDRAARVREFAEVQRVMLTHNPAIWFAAPRVFVATRPRVGGATPRLTRPQVLWNADELFVVN